MSVSALETTLILEFNKKLPFFGTRLTLRSAKKSSTRFN